MSGRWAALVALGMLVVGVEHADAQHRAPVSTAVRRVVEPLAETRSVAADGRAGTPLVVRFDALSQAAALGGIVEVPLAPGLTVRAQVEWTGSDASDLLIAGRLVDGLDGEVNLTVVGDTLVGRVVVGRRVFMIRRAANSNVHVASEIDVQAFPIESQPRVPPGPLPVPAGVAAQEAPADTNQFVDLLIVYTQAARSYMGGTAAIEADLVGAVNNANTALANANVTHRLRLVHRVEIDYTEPAVDNDLNNLTDTNDGILDAVHALRDSYRADEVTLIVRRPGSCGVGWLMGPSSISSSFAPLGFNVVEVGCANANLTLAHEIGHNMGLHHDRANAGSSPAFSYAYGYGADGVGRTVMAYTCPGGGCSRRAVYSTPLRNFPSTTTPAGAATEDNARALEGTSLAVANFRQAVATCTYTLSATAFTMGQAAGVGTVGVTTTAGCAWTASSNTAFMTVTGGASATGSGIVSYSTSANSGALRTGTLTIEGQTFTLTQGPAMSANRASLAFAATNSAGTLGNITAAQAVTVTFAGGSPAWTASPTASWLQVSPGTGSGTGSFTISVVNAAGLPATGTVMGSVTVTSAGATNSQTVAVSLTLFASPTTSAAPFGSFDTPAAAASVAGSIAVTGWALDDIEAVRVEIWRDRVTGETTPLYPGPGLGTGKIFIANAFFVNGARPDIETAYATLPFAYRAGWGYLLLTQGLWSQGNGPFTLHAFAYDKDGHSTSLGSKAITVNNAAATRPFGSIDVPTYGQTVSGAFYNFGWALTPNAVPTCSIGPTQVQMAIDSGTLVPVTYGDLRADIAGAFSGYTNGNGAGGAYYLDTTTLANGTHQIGWFVTDSCGRAEGIGSRFFNVLNGAADSTAVRTTAADSTTPGSPKPQAPSPKPAATGVTTDAPVEARRGFATTLVYPSASGTRIVPIGQGERVEVQLPAIDGATYTGYQVINGARRALPQGSSLDAMSGIFYWQPGTGFLGAHDLEFVSSSAVVRVRAVVGTSVQSVIDTPQRIGGGNPAVTSSFTIAGWAIDEAAITGTGIDTVHVWAYPLTGAGPTFLGVAAYGDARPDIGTLFGEQFTGASYSLAVNDLAPGAYDIVVYPHSAVTGDFRGAQVVRVAVHR